MSAASAGGDVRRPAVAGTFYPGDARALDGEVRALLAAAPGPAQKRVAVMAPHAGYVYSGKTAARAFAACEVPRRVVVLAPNHTGRGKWRALWARGAFALPGFTVPVDEDLCARLAAALEPDHEAHRSEHALEVELPFLHARNPDLLLTPIVLGPLELDECEELGRALASVVAETGDDILVVASSDMNHYLPDDATRKIDRVAIDALLTRDPERLYSTVRERDISMCGVVPATVMLAYARARGATEATLVGYATSAEAFGDTSRVVGYAAVVVD